MTVKIGYSCGMVPIHYFMAKGYQMVSFEEVEKVDDVTISKMLCQSAISGWNFYVHFKPDAMILVNCCNSMQVLADTIMHEDPCFPLYIIEPPSTANSDSIQRYMQDINLISQELEKRFPKTFPTEFTKVRESVLCDCAHICVVGTAISKGVRQQIGEVFREYNIKYFTCQDTITGDMLMSGHVLNGKMLTCAYMHDYLAQFRTTLLDGIECVKGVILLTSRQCTQNLFLLPELREILDELYIPSTIIESDYMQQRNGQVETRLQAFREMTEYGRTMNVRQCHQVVQINNIFIRKLQMVQAFVHRIPFLSIQKLVLHQISMFFEAARNPKKVIWTNMSMPMEIFHAMDIIALNMEMVAGWLATLGLSSAFIDVCHQFGVGQQVCSYHKAVLGLMLQCSEFQPTYMILSSTICDGGHALAKVCKKKFGAKIYIIQVPRPEHEGATEMVLHQLNNLCKWIENNMGYIVSYDRIVNAAEISNKTREMWIETNRIRVRNDSIGGRYVLRNLYGATFLFGSKEGYSIISQYLSDVKKYTANVKLSEKKLKRVLWIHFAPLYNQELMSFIENELNCKIVVDVVSHIYWEPYPIENVFEGMARRLLSHFYYGHIEERINYYKKTICDCCIDGVIHYMHLNCKPICGASRVVRSEVRALGIPYLELYGDCIDPNGHTDSQARMRLQAFREALDGRDNNVHGN